jgi:hypothetical protein
MVQPLVNYWWQDWCLIAWADRLISKVCHPGKNETYPWQKRDMGMAKTGHTPGKNETRKFFLQSASSKCFIKYAGLFGHPHKQEAH